MGDETTPHAFTDLIVVWLPFYLKKLPEYTQLIEAYLSSPRDGGPEHYAEHQRVQEILHRRLLEVMDEEDAEAEAAATLEASKQGE